jgi:2-amino-4-hydroxy-6-hydroxymethyldihydropteridine diphosphokinase
VSLVFVSIGSNLGDRLGLVREAVRRLVGAGDIRVVQTSRLYETEPWERTPGQIPDRSDWFLNCVVALETTLPPRALLERMQAIETALGRTRDPGQTPEAERFAPRALDIDILLYENQVISVADDLHIPHLLMHERAFVLRPLADLAPELEHPTLYRTIGQLMTELEDAHEVRVVDLPRRWLEESP